MLGKGHHLLSEAPYDFAFAARSTLRSLRSSQLKYAAFLVGQATTGTKNDLTDRLYTHLLQDYRLPSDRAPPGTFKAQRIISVDMGIRNLAYCVLDQPQRHLKHNSMPTVTEWKRLDLLSTSPTPAGPKTEPTISKPPTNSKAPAAKRAKTPLPEDAFTPSSLSRLALTTSLTLLSHHPTTILIERQRFRSASGAAIQEWTVRVNMLEAMLWACLRTLQTELPPSSSSSNSSTTTDSIPAPPRREILSVSPARVASFWPSSHNRVSLKPTPSIFEPGRRTSEEKAGTEVVRAGRQKVSKTDKIAVVRRWLSLSSATDSNPDPESGSTAATPSSAEEGDDVSLSFSGQAAQIARLFQTDADGPRRGRRRRRDVDEGEDERNGEAGGEVVDGNGNGNGNDRGKLDDLADCLLQAATWVRWEENRQEMAERLVSSVGVAGAW
ncbi:hypothetical protein BAUCODRAFT_130590 [Baudoinia panamericana UAMH 10762]|uniref:SAP domain-containing protein n=1 Tax=Baudoinia panamericana (strain UAMH 10762) TaxID=717646 RepID=M2ML95_BAUPA|nr:uncharacterized protein BAUCODRAFT_130590 [Baudoinia panamericana UAMH 10762]EMC97446.1 hypothetical protein BAUCODRAFT_130590 [Baudoinia panamericana UAMH 10762]